MFATGGGGHNEATFQFDDGGGAGVGAGDDTGFNAFDEGGWMNTSTGSEGVDGGNMSSFVPAELNEAAEAVRNLGNDDMEEHMAAMNMGDSADANAEASSEQRRQRSRRSQTGPKRRSSLKGAAAI